MVYIIVLGILLVVSAYININLFRKIEILETDLEYMDNAIDSVYESMERSYSRMKSIDRLGSFEADDETGFIFEEIKSAMEQLNNEYNLDGETQKETE